MSKIDNNALVLYKERINLNEVLSSTVDDIRENVISDNKKVNIVYNNSVIVDKDLIIEADKQRIIQVIFNILDNAIKFTKEGTININIEKSGGISDKYGGKFLDERKRILIESYSSPSRAVDYIIEKLQTK